MPIFHRYSETKHGIGKDVEENFMKQTKTTETKVTKAAAKTTEAAVKEAAPAKEEVKAAPAETVKAEPVKEEKKAPAKKTAAKTTAKTTAKKETAKAPAKKTPAKKTAAPAEVKEEVKAQVCVQYAGKSYTTEDLVKIAKDVWQYDLGKAAEDFKSVELYVKPEENVVYYVINGEISGNYAI